MSRQTEFLALIRENERLIWRVCNLYVDDADEREDLFQEVVGQAWRSFDNFRGDSKFTTWLYRVALNTAISQHRKRIRRRRVEALGEILHQAPAADPYEEEVGLMYAAIGRLSKVDKALVLLYLDDKSYEEMAEIMGFTVTNVGVRLNRIRKRLKDDCTPDN